MNTPVYMHRSKQFLINRLEKLQKMASPCQLCPRHCKVDRSMGSVGFCKTGMLSEIASFALIMEKKNRYQGDLVQELFSLLDAICSVYSVRISK